MRWDNLFDDLEGQLEHELDAEDVDLRAEEERLRLGRMTIRDRLLALGASGRPGDAPVRVVLKSGATIAIRTEMFGRDWVSGHLDEVQSRAAQFILPLESVTSLLLSAEQVSSSIAPREIRDGASDLSRRLGLGFVLRDLCRRRSSVEITVGDRIVHGTIDRVGRDHFDLAEHELGTPRRRSEVTQLRVVAFGQLGFVRL